MFVFKTRSQYIGLAGLELAEEFTAIPGNILKGLESAQDTPRPKLPLTFIRLVCLVTEKGTAVTHFQALTYVFMPLPHGPFKSHHLPGSINRSPPTVVRHHGLLQVQLMELNLLTLPPGIPSSSSMGFPGTPQISASLDVSHHEARVLVNPPVSS